MYCTNASIVKVEGKTRTAISLRCRAWTCAECAPIRKRQLIAEVLGGAPTTFITLTSKRRPDKTPVEAARALAHAWRLVKLRLLRLRGWKRLPYFAVFEATKLGWPHLHIMLRTVWIDQRWLSQQMDELVQSPIVDVRRIDHRGRAAGYIGKYAGKASHKFGTCKRYWQTRDYDLRPEPAEKFKAPPGDGWERWDQTLDRIAKAWNELGWQPVWLGSHRLKCTTGPP